MKRKRKIEPHKLVSGFSKALTNAGYIHKKRQFLCKEPGGSNLPDEEFIIDASDLEDARESASMWNAVVIKEITNENTKQTRKTGS